ncbi:MAG: endolytic transglycosylase MltG [Fimbriimonadaceae bacterium]
MGSEKVVKDASAFIFRAKIERKQQLIADGTYEFEPGMDFDKVILNMKKPLSTMVRIPEGWWIARVAKRLEEKQVCKADEYIELANNPSEFKDDVSFTLPEESLEGYLYPDTYDLPPLIGARSAIKRQLQAFQKKVVDELGEEGLERAVNVGSMIELEAALDEERPIIAGVIENRIKQGCGQLDATVLYALQEWKQLGPGVVNTVDSPYNTYRNAGLPPGPIGSPSFRSIEAAMKPATHDKLFYVARPNRSPLLFPHL